MRAWGQRLTAWIVASLVTLALASLAHSLMVQGELAALGVALPFGVRLRGIGQDFIGLVPALGSVLAIALAVAFLIAGFLKRRAGFLGRFAYPLAGWAAVLLALTAMRLAFGFSALAGARTGLGLLLMSLSGLVGGAVFAFIAGRTRR